MARVSEKVQCLALVRYDLGFKCGGRDPCSLGPYAASTSSALALLSLRLSSLGHRMAASSSRWGSVLLWSHPVALAFPVPACVPLDCSGGSGTMPGLELPALETLRLRA